MSEQTATIKSVDAARAVGRCYGALFFAVFGGVWILLAIYAFGSLNRYGALGIALVSALFVVVALRLLARGKDAAEDAFPKEQKERNDRDFGIVNAVTWVSVFLALQILPRLGLKNFSIPVVALIVGLHFFPMPPLYRHRANFVTGGCLVVWTVLCMLIWRGDLMIAFVAAGAGVVLWASSAWALWTAKQLLSQASV